jgi:hypothetical protein
MQSTDHMPAQGEQRSITRRASLGKGCLVPLTNDWADKMLHYARTAAMRKLRRGI